MSNRGAAWGMYLAALVAVWSIPLASLRDALGGAQTNVLFSCLVYFTF